MVTATARKVARSTIDLHSAAGAPSAEAARRDAADELSSLATTTKVWEARRHGRGLDTAAADDPEPAERFGDGDDEEIKEVRERLMTHLREAADRMGLAVVGGGAAAVDPDHEAPPPETRTTRSLRPRRTAWRRSSAQASRRRFSVALRKEEIDEDFYAVTGKLPRRRPTKRPRAVQKQLDMLFPGGWLTEITVETYKLTGGPVQ